MANTTLQLKKSGVTGNVPSSLEFGELALNYADGKLYYKAANGTITYIQSGSGVETDSFATINANSSLILATSPTDTLSIVPGNNITIDTDVLNKVITINSDSSLAQEAYDVASSASANTIVIQGVNDWQNTQIQYVNEFAQAAYNQANTGGGVSTTVISDNNTSNNVVYINFTANTSGNLNVIETSSANLTFTPSTGTLNVFGLNITPNTSINSKTLNVTGPTVIDSLPTSTYRSAFYQIQMEFNNLNFHILNLNVLQVNSSANTIVYGELFDDFSLGTFSASISDGNLNVIFTPTEPNTQVSFIRSALTRNGASIPGGSLGFVTQPVIDILDAGFVSDPVDTIYDYGNLS